MNEPWPCGSPGVCQRTSPVAASSAAIDAVGRAGIDDDHVIDDQRRRARAPRQLVESEKLEPDVGSPHDGAGLSVGAGEIAEGAEEVDAAVVNQRRGPRRVVVVELAERRDT